jgi:hypothetical protein
VNKYAHLTLEQLVRNHTPIAQDHECWNWTGAKLKTRYGVLTHKRKQYKAHRAMYTLTKGEIPNGMFVCHSCDNPSCVNPKHLWLGTPLDNMLDKVAKNRHSRGESHADAVKSSLKFRAGILRGENHSQSKLSDSNRIDILKKLRFGLTQDKIAKEYNVTQGTISHIYRKWRVSQNVIL